MLYRISFWVPSKTERGWERTGIVQVVGNLKQAGRIAAVLLAPHVRHETWYTSQRDRGAFVQLEHVKSRNVVARETISATVHIVPSVGELGWTP